MRHIWRVILVVGLASWLFSGCAAKATPNQPTATPFPGAAQEKKVEKKVMTEAEEEAFVDLIASEKEQRIRELAKEIERNKALEAAEKRLRAHDSPAVHEARKLVEKAEERRASLARESAKLSKQAAVTGCAPGTVVVDPRAVEFTSWVDSVSVRITNTSSSSRNIETSFRGIGVAVKNLCAGGSVSLGFARNWSGSQYENIILIAKGTGERGRIVTEQFSMGLYMSYGTNGVSSQMYQWAISAR
ncbi:MAG: hypothetical protein A3H52_02140 [Candidatus Zambryskibacteria bacterium RIFCSPLOWO2_02_FULL_39_26]|uniref:Uncharacterized protein n=1 Tax=Candidatus Zambryskibacteria bacterium RIFCSPLOWO2_12_FULL_39_23 TaxID=1802776 RepID=A0A1G2URR2_9BACT|nr:MAG: hypothetical protein A3H52_02140 [Candidatus Zambryskibacteria bacterium RIFCSPLOWO2_02_FULL_39_26]OHB12058.1 MAG: hypothetical protein A3G99_03100 [Candidatus Zambryskibacteria bacterium RIFCSPLOWO2_12_FULL_39_23]